MDSAGPSSSHLDKEKLLKMAGENKSKKNPFNFEEMVQQMSASEINSMWKQLLHITADLLRYIYGKNNDLNFSSSKELHLEIGPVIQAVIDIAQAMFSDCIELSAEFLRTVMFLNDNLYILPDSLDILRNNISLTCEKVLNIVSINHHELFIYNCLKYLLERSTRQKATKKDVKRVWALRSFFPKILALEKVDSNEFWPLFRKCAVSSVYLSIPEGQKVISHVLTLNVSRVFEIHEEIKKKLGSRTTNQATLYGKIYYAAWLYTVKTKAERLKQELEFVCVKDLIEYAILEKNDSNISSARKILSEFHLKRNEITVARMLFSFYQPILCRYLKNSDGLTRANAAQLLLDVFPLEDPDADIVMSDQELNNQMLSIKELLTDEYPIVRRRAIIGLCLAMSLHYELFSEEMIKTYLNILVDELALDSSSLEVRCSVAKGFKGLLTNPLTVPAVRSILPKLQPLFDDTSNMVRIAFCQLLLSVKKVSGIKYYDIVPIRHLVARMEEDPAVAKLIVNLIHNSYFPKGEPPSSWLFRCIEIIKLDNEASREFFHYAPRYVEVDTGAKFMIQAIRTIYLYVKSKISTESSNDSPDIQALGDVVDFSSNILVKSIIDAVVVLWFSCNLTKPENKTQLKMVVANFSKWMEELLYYFEDTEVWPSLYYLASFLPSQYVPSLVDRCYKRLKSEEKSMEYTFYNVLLHCLCNLGEGDSLLETLKGWISLGLSETTVKKNTPKRRKTGEVALMKKPILGLQMLNDLLDYQPFQKVITVQHAGKLRTLLELFDNLKVKTESLVHVKINNDHISFISNLLFALSKLSVLLHGQENFNGIKQVEKIVLWVDNKLCKIVWPKNSITNTRRRSSAISQVECSFSFKKLVKDICKDLCLLLSDMSYLGLFDTKGNKFMKFGMKLLSLELDASTLLQVSKLFVKHVWYGAFRYSFENEDDVLLIIPDCFNEISGYISALERTGTTPSNILKEIKLNIATSMKTLDKADISISFIKTMSTNESQVLNASQNSRIISEELISAS